MILGVAELVAQLSSFLHTFEILTSCGIQAPHTWSALMLCLGRVRRVPGKVDGRLL